MTKLSINIKDGFLEIESENDKLVEMVYSDFKATMFSNVSIRTENNADLTHVEKKDPTSPYSETKNSSGIKKTSKGVKINETYKLDADLNLWKTDTKLGLKEFYTEKAPSTGYECNVIFVYYLQKVAKIEKINVNHIYTCYKEVGRAYPNALKQNLFDTKRDKGWIDTTDIAAITLTSKGENYVEHNFTIKKQ